MVEARTNTLVAGQRASRQSNLFLTELLVDVGACTAATHVPSRRPRAELAGRAVGEIAVRGTKVVASIAHGWAPTGRERVWGTTHGAGSTQHAVVAALASIGARGRRDEAVALGGNHRRHLLQRTRREAIGVG